MTVINARERQRQRRLAAVALDSCHEVGRLKHLRFVPTSDSCTAANLSLFKGSVGGLRSRKSRQLFLDQSRKETCSNRQCSVVEIVMRVVNADATGVANSDIGGSE
jgi:hypothetical protein